LHSLIKALRLSSWTKGCVLAQSYRREIKTPPLVKEATLLILIDLKIDIIPIQY